MLTIRLFKNLKRGIKWSSSKSSFIQVLHQQIGGGGVYVCADSADAGGGPKFGKHADIIQTESTFVNDMFLDELKSKSAEEQGYVICSIMNEMNNIEKLKIIMIFYDE